VTPFVPLTLPIAANSIGSSKVWGNAMGEAVVLAGSALAFTQKPKAEHFNAPPVDETPLQREMGHHSSFSPVVKKVAPGVVKVFTSTKLNSGLSDDLFTQRKKRHDAVDAVEQFRPKKPAGLLDEMPARRLG
jgi:S1-C subfamily serine protease